MKKVLVAFVLFATVACEKETPIDYALVSGKILNSESKEMKLFSADRKVTRTLVIDSLGMFSDTLRVKPGVFSFYDGKNYKDFYIDTAFNINISYDAEDFKNTLSYTGTGSEISNYLLAKTSKTTDLMGEGTKVYELDETSYKTKVKEIETVITELISTTEGISEEYKDKEKADVKYAYLANINKYQSYHSHYAKKPDFKVSENFLEELNSIDYGNESDYFASSNYKSLVNGHYQEIASKLAESDSLDRGIAFIKTAGEISSIKIKNDLLSSSVRGLKYASDMKAYYELFMKTSTDEDDKKTMDEMFEKLKTVAKGQQSPKFENYENNAGGTTSLDDLKGKYVYIDVWATWCGPCIAEIPSLKKVEKQYHGKNIEFLSLSIDNAKDHDKWKKMIVDKELGGIQLFADNAWASKFVKDYLINGIPHFILLDPEGKIVRYSAPRPSNVKLVELFDELGI